MNAIQRVGIAGAGAWGMALAEAAKRAGRDVFLWSRRGAAAGHDGTFPVTGDDKAVAQADALLLVVPAQELAGVAERLTPHLRRTTPLVICAKGLARPGNTLLSDVLEKALPGHPVAVLSGPTFAAEVARGQPTAVTVASSDENLAHALINALGSTSFRPYASSDPVGVQLAGAVKNVIAIACGIVAGRTLGENTRAALMTRGLAEMTRLGRALGASPETFAGLAGLGDLSLTATSPTSRNFRFGLMLGKGDTINAARGKISGVVEGAKTAAAVVELAARHQVDVPISAAIAAIVEQGADIDATIAGLLMRPFKAETA